MAGNHISFLDMKILQDWCLHFGCELKVLDWLSDIYDIVAEKDFHIVAFIEKAQNVVQMSWDSKL